jgi:hypothetical protein
MILVAALALWGSFLEKILNRWLTPPVAPKSISP